MPASSSWRRPPSPATSRRRRARTRRWRGAWPAGRARVQRKLEAFSRATVEARVAGALLEIAEDAGTPLGGGAIRLDLPLSQEDLAALAGTTRESCSTAVAAFAPAAGSIRGSRLRGLVLADPARLADLAAVDFRPP